mmetsp:Transcript_34868/g.89534  ORF Transcript_34868/g.89534 Transcript_34868/m.89534 type:complete len:264 (+) Transcript_34868:292-1083(+)
MRLDVCNNSIIIASFVACFKEVRKSWWMPRVLELSVQSDEPIRSLRLTQGPPDFMAPDFLHYDGRNYGFITHVSEPLVLMWVTQPLAIRATGARKDETEGPLWQGATKSKSILALGGKTMHGSGSPLHLPQLNVMLVVGHVHLDEQKGTLQRGSLTRYGNTYFHYFLLAEDKPPWRVISQSPAWCLPSQQDPQRCETIQFVVTLLRSLQNPRHLILSYGINDCESRVQLLDLSQVLAFARRHNVTVSKHGPFDSATVSKRGPP